MKQFFLYLFLCFSFIAGAQTVKLETLNEYRAIDDSLYQVGNALTFNKGSYDGYFLYIYDSGFSYKKEIEKKAERALPKVIQQKYPFTGKTYTIKEFIKRTDGDNVKTYTVITDGINKFYIDLDKCIQHKECINSRNQYMHFDGEYFENQTAFLVFIKATNEPEKYLEEYQYRFNRKPFLQFRDDEFEFHDKKKGWEKDLENEINGLKDSVVFKNPTKIEFGDYNFEQGYFPLKLSNDSYYTIIQNGLYALGDDSKYQKTNLNLIYSNADQFNKLVLSNEKAKALVNQNKSSNGQVNRNLYTLIHFRIDYDKTRKLYLKNPENKTFFLVGIITMIEVYDSKNYDVRMAVIQ